MTEPESNEWIAPTAEEYQAIAVRAKEHTDGAVKAHGEIWGALLKDPDLSSMQRLEMLLARSELMQAICGQFADALYPDRPESVIVAALVHQDDVDRLRDAIARLPLRSTPGFQL